MDRAMILRLIVGTGGLLFLVADFLSLARRRMKETLGLGWAIFAVLLILVSAIPGLAGWSRQVPTEAACVLLLIGGCAVIGIFSLSIAVSQLMMKNQELAMQVSLLNQENERILHEMEKLTGKSKVTL